MNLRTVAIVIVGLVAVALFSQGVDLHAAPPSATTIAANEPQAADAASSDARQCLRLKQERPSAWNIGEDKYRRMLKGWVEACSRAVTSDDGDSRLKIALSNALFASDRRAEAIVPLRAAAAADDPDALVEIYEWHKSWERGNTGRAQTVTRTEAADTLRRAAELGHPYAMHRLAVLFDRGDIVRRDNAAAIHWAEKSLQKPDKDWRPIDIATLLGRLLSQSDRREQQARGIEMLERLARSGRGDAKAYLARAIRGTDPVRARQLLEEAMRGWDGAALPTLAEMLIAGEGGAADPQRALTLLKAGATPGGVAAVSFALGRLHRDGRLLPRDPQEAARLMRGEVQWSVEATLELARLAIDNPTVTIEQPADFLGALTNAAELGEPDAEDTLIALRLSTSTQFADRADGCRRAATAIRRSEPIAALTAACAAP